MTITVNDQSFEHSVWDTIADDGHYERLRPLSYPDTSLFFFCFSLVDPSTFANIEDKVSSSKSMRIVN
jgi:GTPase SAR1 family protein